MYSSKENVNLLTALLVAHGIGRAVVCPGSRNAPIVHNLNECPDIKCYAATDERSAGFYALGIALTQTPVAVCVTSGTALLNLLPAVAESYYQKVPLVVISADRPPQWIDQLDGQTLPQASALKPFVKKAVTLPEPRNDEERWYCQRLINEALIEEDGPVHINVPISEPLFDFSQAELPKAKPVFCVTPSNTQNAKLLISDESTFLNDFYRAEKPMIVVGQYNDTGRLCSMLNDIARQVVVIHEALLCETLINGVGNQDTIHFDEVLESHGNDTELMPDSIIYIGGTLVSKRLKAFLRKAAPEAAFYRVSPEGELTDTFQHLSYLMKMSPELVLANIDKTCRNGRFYDIETDKWAVFPYAPSPFYNRWQTLLTQAENHADAYEPAFSQMATVKHFENELWNEENDEFFIHYANSSVIRLANIYAWHGVYCNRGVNGIEGSLSTAAGFSLETVQPVYCVIGDLSFFYDQNALWNQHLRGNLRILLLNNGGGGIFRMLGGLEQSPVRDTLVSAGHNTSAEGICRQNGINYRHASNMEEMQQGISWLLTADESSPLLLEVATNATEDELTLKEYYRKCSL